MNHQLLRRTLDRVGYHGWRFRVWDKVENTLIFNVVFDAPDSNDVTILRLGIEGRAWIVEWAASIDDVVGLARDAILHAVEHEVLEDMRLDGLPFFNPHRNP